MQVRIWHLQAGKSQFTGFITRSSEQSISSKTNSNRRRHGRNKSPQMSFYREWFEQNNGTGGAIEAMELNEHGAAINVKLLQMFLKQLLKKIVTQNLILKYNYSQ